MLLHSYNREVISGLVRLGDSPSMVNYAKEATRFRIGSREAKETVGRQLDELAATGQRVAIWGGTGKAAAFINNYAVDAKRFPLVVDSDPDKFGTHVPGQGQLIQSRDLLRDAPAEVLIIPMQWRARDILNEMEREQIQCPLVLIEHEGRLVNFEQEEHPY